MTYFLNSRLIIIYNIYSRINLLFLDFWFSLLAVKYKYLIYYSGSPRIRYICSMRTMYMLSVY